MTTSAIIKTTEKTNLWLNELGRELGWDQESQVFKALRAVLHELRDRLPIVESAQLASQLPMLIRGAYYENWKPNMKPKHVSAEEFLSHVRQSFTGDEEIDAAEVTRAVFRVMDGHITKGEMDDVRACLSKDYAELWY